MIRAPIETSLSTKKRRLSNIFSKMRIVPRACVATVTAIEVRSAGKAGQMPLSIFGICPPKSSSMRRSWSGRHADARVGHLHARCRASRNAGTIEIRSSGSTSSTTTSPPVAAARPTKLATSMWSGPDPVLGPAELAHALDVEDVRADPVDPGAERDEEAAEVLDVRLACGVPEHRLALGEHGGHDRVLGAHDGGLVEVHPRAPKPLASQLVDAVHLELGAERREGVDVRVQAPAADDVAAGRRHADPAEAREQRAGEQERRADLAGEHRVEVGLRDACRVDADLVRPDPLDIRADVGEELDHRLDVADPRDVREAHLVRARGRTRRGSASARVLVPGRPGRCPQSGRPPSMTNDCMARGMVLRPARSPRRLGRSGRRCSISSVGTSPPGSKPRT